MSIEGILLEADKNDVHLLGIDAKNGKLVAIRNAFTGDIVTLNFWQRIRLIFNHVV